MKELNITSFLMAIALSFLSYTASIAQSSTDCQSEINLSIGGGCASAIPYEAFNSWLPSCMVIKQDEMTMAVIAGSGSFATSKLNCFMQIDSVWLDTFPSIKITPYRIPMWTITCDGGIGPDTTIYADLTQLPAFCDADTFVRLVAGLGLATPIAPGTVVVQADYVPTCPHSDRFASEGELIFTDTVTTLTFKQYVKQVQRVDTFSHTDPLRWVKGTTILDVNGVDSIVHGFKAVDHKKTIVKCGTPPTLSTIFGATVFPGPNVLLPGRYIYNSYSPDARNYCWGYLNMQYKLWPNIDSRKDTISCVDVTAFDRSPEGGHYDYHAKTKEKLEDVCAWTEQIYTGGSTRVLPSPGVPGVAALRSAARVAWEINQQVRHCYVHTVTTKDRYIKDFNWLCDTVVKERSFIADKQDHDGSITTAVLVKDTLLIIPINVFDIHFPDSLVVMKCGIIEDESPDEIAEYLYKAFEHFDYTNTPVLTGLNQGGPSGFTTGSPCELFADQYSSYDLKPYHGTDLTNEELWKKIFKGADYNNWGVKKAFPYAVRTNKLIDHGLKNKISALILSGDVKKGADFDYSLDSVLIPINKIICNIAATKIDLHPIEICGGERKIFRKWSIIDWCTGTIREKTQIIKFVDNEAPVVTSYDSHDGKEFLHSSEKMKIATGDSVKVRWEKIINPWGCTANHKFPYLGLKEHCSEASYHFELLNSSLVSDGTTYSPGDVVQLPWSHGDGFEYPIVKVMLWDECDNEGVSYYYLKGLDKLPPVVVLHDHINVTLTADKTNPTGNAEGVAKVFCYDIDAGSHDGNCGDLNPCKIRIQGTEEWEDAVHFGCDDIGDQIVEFRAEDWSGNTSIGWMIVSIENKLNAVLICEDITVDCTDPIHPDWIGYPHVSGICSTPELEYSDEFNVDDLCFKGTISRTWTIVDSSPKVTCVQTITIDATDNGGDNSLFDPKSIKWPLHHTGQSLEESGLNTQWISIRDKDAHDICRDFTYDNYETFRKLTDPSFDIEEEILEECGMNEKFICELGDTEEPTWEDPACGLVGKTFDDQVFKFGDGACFKILRYWAVIDWCKYDPKVGDAYPEEVEYVKDFCYSEAYFRIRGEVKQDGYYSYTQEIKVIDETPPAISVQDTIVEIGVGGKNSDEECSKEVVLCARATDFCEDEIIPASSEHSHLTWSAKLVEIDDHGKEVGVVTVVDDIQTSTENGTAIAKLSITGHAGKAYYVKWSAKDGCNNKAEVVQKVEFIDVKAPVLLCKAALSTNVMNTDGTTEIWANDFGTAYDCEGEETQVWFKDSSGSLVPSLIFNCDDLNGQSVETINLQVYSADAQGNEAFCEVTLRIVDSGDACGNGNGQVEGAALVSGEVRTRLGDMVESAEISLAQSSRMTSTDGLFAFESTPMGLDYEILAKKSDDYLNGVSTLDLVLIQKHILGLDVFDSPYKVIAADINNSESVSAIDLVELRKLILGLYEELPNNESWRFADASKTFADALSPFPFIETIDVDFLAEDRLNEDFIAIKIGDVSGNAIANSLITSGRSNQSMTLKAADAYVKSGEVVRLEVSSDEFIDMNALQFTMAIAGLEYLAIEPGELAMTDENLAIFDGRLTAAWYDVNTVTSDNVLFTLVFKAQKSTTLSNAISIGSTITMAHAYKSNNDGVNVTLAFKTAEGLVDGSTFELFQNRPNPFETVTTIGFQLSEAGAAKMTVFDVTGKIITSVHGQYSRGYNEISLNKSELGASGVLYYQLESGDFTATRKMILID